MLVRDVRTGQLVAVPNNRLSAAPFGGYGGGSYAPRSAHATANGFANGGFEAPPQQVIYDGLGHPLGLPFLAALAPMAASVLPALLPSLAGGLASLFKSIGGPLSGVPAAGPGFGYVPTANMHGLGAVPGFGYYGAAPPQVIYDGLGNPLGLPFLAALAPALSSLLPALASGASKILPGLISQAAAALPALAQSAAPAPSVSPMPMPPPSPSPLPVPEPVPDAGPREAPPIVRAPMQPPEEIIAPMRVQGPNGQPMVVPVRLRRRGRRRGRRMRRAPPMVIARPPTPDVGFAPGFGSPVHPLGWYGFNGWRGG